MNGLRFRCWADRVAGRAVLTYALVLSAASQAQAAADESLPRDAISPLFLGMYRKVMVIEDEIRRMSARYGVDPDLSRAVCLYESGGNEDLSSSVGAQGYFQVMPATFRMLGIKSNIEAGVKYLSQMIHLFGREDRAIAAYNGGPGRVSRQGAGLPLETLQYVLGVGEYRTLLKAHDASLRYHAAGIELTSVKAGEDWPAIARRLDVPEWEVRLHNPFLARRRLRPGQLVASSLQRRDDLFERVGDSVEYRMRLGDNYVKLAYTLGVDVGELRTANGLWHLQSVPVGAVLRIPLVADRAFLLHAALGAERPSESEGMLVAEEAPQPAGRPLATVERASAAPAAAAEASAPVSHRVERGETLSGLARRYGRSLGQLQQANGLSARAIIRVGQLLRIPAAGGAPPHAVPRHLVHCVAPGETLDALAKRYGTTVRDIQRANGMRRTVIRVGERLQIPAPAATIGEKMVGSGVHG